MFYKNVKTIKKPNSIKVLVNKNNKLNKNYIPKNLVKVPNEYSIKVCYLRKRCANRFIKLCNLAKKQGFNIKAASCYRDYNYQKKVYNEYIKEKGKEYTDLCSARPGHSEHQTGLAVDVKGSIGTYDDFDKTKEFTWMINNSYKLGFILRYPKGKENITGFKHEPWHYRYVGKRIAKKIYKMKITLEEYLKRR